MKKTTLSMLALAALLTLGLPAALNADDAAPAAAPDEGASTPIFTPEPLLQTPPACHKQDQYPAEAWDVYPSSECPMACVDACQQNGGGTYAGIYWYDMRSGACHCTCCPPA